MTHRIASRVWETSTTAGVGSFTLAGAVSGFIAFSAISSMVDGDTVFYAAESVDAEGVPTGSWEEGLGTWRTGGTLERTTVLSSSNGGSPVNFAAGTKNIFLTDPASQKAVTTAYSRSLLGGVDAAAVRTLLALGTLATQSGTFSGATSGTNTGDQTITLTGDVTGSGTGSFAATIAAGAITLAKMANMATASLIYRKTEGSGTPEINTLATLKTDLGLTGTNSGDETASGLLTKLLTVDGSGSGLDADFLDGQSSAAFAAASHSHAASDIASGTVATARLGSGAANSSSFLRGDQTWAVVTAGDASGPASSTDNAIARFDGTTGKLIQNSNVTISDSGIFTFGGSATFDFSANIVNAFLFSVNGGGYNFVVHSGGPSSVGYNFASYAGGTTDARFERVGSAIIKVSDGGSGAGVIVTPSQTVSSLPSAVTAGAGARSFVTDATATTFLSTVSGGGSNKVPVVSDGANWLIG